MTDTEISRMMKNIKPFYLALLLSVLIHATLTFFVWLQPTDSFKASKKDDKVEVELVDAQELLQQLQPTVTAPQPQAPTKGQIVEQNEKALNDEVPDDARFLSRHNQKVVRETQAAVTGKFKNSDNTGGEQAQEKEIGKETKSEDAEQPTQTTENEKPTHILTSPDGVAVKTKPTLKDLVPSFKPGIPRVDSDDVAKGGDEGPSATDDHLKNIATGMQTLLSTREFVYYSYYNRIKDKLRQYWEPKIKEKMERILRQGRTIASSNDRITKIVIILDENGTLQRVQVIGASGVQDLDEAAVEAFKAAAPFPNPPKGIVEEDGFIRIRWDFILEANANGFFNAVRMAHSSSDE